MSTFKKKTYSYEEIVMAWTKERIIALNKLICEASGQPHAIRDEGTIDLACKHFKKLTRQRIEIIGCNIISENHPFVEGNKRTAACIAVCMTLEGV